MLKNRRVLTADRRQQQRDLNGVPFKDSNGVTVRGERRFMRDRRSVSTKPGEGQQGPQTA